MKNLVYLVILAITAFGFTNPNQPQIIFNTNGVLSANAEWGAAITLSEEDFNSLTSAYQAANPEATHGGAIGKSQLNTLINSMPSGAQYISLMFCTDASAGKTSLILAGDKRWYQSSSQVKYLRNGGSNDAFCPMMCNTDITASNVSINLTHQEYTTFTNDFAAANPGKTRGGRIDKASLSAIINSLPVSAVTVSFRFCTDPSTSNTSVIFIGGSNGQNDNKTLYVRNGKNADAYCPMMCN